MGEEVKLEKLAKTLEDHERRLKAIEEKLLAEGNGGMEILKTTIVSPSAIDSKLTLAKKIGTSLEGIDNLFEIDGTNLTITKRPEGKPNEMTQKVVLAILTGAKFLIGTREVLSKDLRRNVALHRIPIENFSTHLKEIEPKLILQKGKLKSPKTAYKLTYAGEAEGLEIIKNLLMGEN